MQDAQRIALSKIILAVYETIKEAGEQGAPSGVIYAALMGFGCSLEQYNAIIDAMIATKKIRRSNHLLYAIL
jgi:predicted oxidoreductase (fatty acid repression mutant protein)